MVMKVWKCINLVQILNLISRYASEPCNTYSWLSYSEYRGSACQSLNGKELCDKYNDIGWYRIKDNSTIVTKKPELFSCATTHPIWLNGSLPTTSNEEEYVACVNYGESETGCDEEIPLKVKRCSGYYVYFLNRPNHCDSAFCFGTNKTCKQFDQCDFYYHEQKTEILGKDNLCQMHGQWIKLENQVLDTECRSTSHSDIWLNISYPIKPGEVGVASVCVRSNQSCCIGYIPTEVKNCTEYLVYKISTNYSCICGDICEDFNGAKMPLNQILLTLMCSFISFLSPLILFVSQK